MVEGCRHGCSAGTRARRRPAQRPPVPASAPVRRCRPLGGGSGGANATALWCTFMFSSKRCKLVKRLWEERAKLVQGCDEHEALCSLEAAECAKKAVEAMLKRLREPQLETMLHAVQSRGRNGRGCLLLQGDEPVRLPREAIAPHVLCCRLWRWPHLRHHYQLRRMPWCGTSPMHVCCNPYHWSIVQEPGGCHKKHLASS